MGETSSAQVTRLLLDWQNGDQAALDQLIPIVYHELHRIAEIRLGQERAGHTLQPTALIHEAYLRLIGQDMPEWKNRAHFFGVAANIMRQILVDHARKFASQKRGGRQKKVTLEDALAVSENQYDTVLILDQALTALGAFDKRKSRVLELRYFAGLDIAETANALGISEKTVSRDLRMAESWLKREFFA
jgi:RNA polymerase sigma-70 factor, ECF subfamily